MQIHYAERLGFNENDNLINYVCGPFKIHLDYCAKKITIKYTDPIWAEYTPNLLESLSEMLELQEEQISKEILTITIDKLTPLELENYFTYIIFI